ncbi:MAG: hypothetical protein LAP39_20040 [Acidobacteriia bacterium]|nr:hypothetical protein [Terriglobia bacterium]
MPDEADKGLLERLARIERELGHLKDALGLLGVRRCCRCQKFFRRADGAALFDCGDLVCYPCIHEWWPRRCAELAVKDREIIERRLVSWLVTHHNGQVIHDLRKMPEDHLQELRIVATCGECNGTGAQGHQRCPYCDGGSIWVVVPRRRGDRETAPE